MNPFSRSDWKRAARRAQDYRGPGLIDRVGISGWEIIAVLIVIAILKLVLNWLGIE